MQDGFFSSLVSASPDAIVSIDRASTILSVNDAAVKLFGFPRDEFVGKSLMETIIPREFGAQHLNGMTRLEQTGHGPAIGRRIDITARDCNNRRFPIELCVFLDRDRPREVFHASIRETSDRVARDAVVKAERDRLVQMLDATADAWWDCDLNGATRYSDSSAGFLGCAISELPTTVPSRIPSIHQSDRARVVEAWRAHLEGSVARFECTHRVVGSDGVERWVRQRGRAVEFAAGRPTRMVGTMADVTEQQVADKRLRSAQRLELLGLVAGGFAHDLNNLLAAIRGHAALAASEPGMSASTLDSLQSVQLATAKARLLATNMLSLGKPAEDSIVSFPVRNAIEESVDIVRPGLPRSIHIAVEVKQVEGVEIELDPSAFQQVLINLILNARDAMPGGGRLRVEAVALKSDSVVEAVRIVVEDTGVGVSPEDLTRLFEPFFTTKPQGHGTGLGLAAVQRVVVGAGGTVSVESDLGHGTRFTLILPARLVVSTPTAVLAAPAQPQVVLLAETHAVLRPMLAEALRAMGHAVVEADSGEHAISLARERANARVGERVSALVVELGSRGLSGQQVHAQVESVMGTRIPVVFLSQNPASTLPPDTRTDRRLLQKPFDLEELVRAIEAITTDPVSAR